MCLKLGHETNAVRSCMSHYGAPAPLRTWLAIAWLSVMHI